MSSVKIIRIAKGMPLRIRLAASWSLYGCGHVTSLPMVHWDLAFLYPLYNALMLASDEIQGDLEQGPWGSPAEDDHEDTNAPLRS